MPPHGPPHGAGREDSRDCSPDAPGNCDEHAPNPRLPAAGARAVARLCALEHTGRAGVCARAAGGDLLALTSMRLSTEARDRRLNRPAPPFDVKRASPSSGVGRTLWTTGERAVQPCADDRNRGRKRAQTGPGVDRLLIVLRRRTDPSPTGTPIRGRVRCKRTTAADAGRRHAIGCSISAPAGGAMVVLNQQPAPRRSRRDDLVGLPSTWVVARIAGRAP